MHQAKSCLSKLVERAEHGEEVVLARNGTPVARIVPLRTAKRIPGTAKGKIWIADDFDAPLPSELLDAFEGRR